MNVTADEEDVFDLSVIVPVYNAEAHLPQLVDQVLALDKYGLNCEMICLDDASSDDSAVILRNLTKSHSKLKLIESGENRGAGIARNEAWLHARGRYTIFFDADDTLHGEVLVDAIKDMDRNADVDVAVFAYRYEREATASFTGMGHEDEKILKYLLNGTAVATGSIEAMGRLLSFTNYPWNKLLRTAHYKRVGLRFGRTKVNNDILGHWYTILLARKIMVRNAINCTHIVHPKGNNLTNSFGVDRLMMFDALQEAYDFLEANPAFRRRFAHHFWALSSRLVAWARVRIDPELSLQFEASYTDLLGRIDLSDLARMRTKHSPALADSLVKHLTR